MLKKLCATLVLAVVCVTSVNAAESLDHVDELFEKIQKGYFKAVSSPKSSMASKHYESMLKSLQIQAKEVDKITAKSKSASVRAIKLYPYASKLVSMYRSALSKQSASVIDCKVFSQFTFLAATDIEQNRKFHLWMISEGIKRLKQYNYPNFKSPYSKHADLLKAKLGELISLVEIFNDEAEATSSLNFVEEGDNRSFRFSGGNVEYDRTRRARKRYSFIRTVEQDSVLYEAHGYTKTGFNGTFIVEDIKLSYKSPDGAEFKTTKLSVRKQQICSNIRKTVDYKLVALMKIYKKAPNALKQTDDGTKVSQLLYSMQKWARAFRGGKSPAPKIVSEFNFAFNGMKDIYTKIGGQPLEDRRHVADKRQTTPVRVVTNSKDLFEFKQGDAGCIITDVKGSFVGGIRIPSKIEGKAVTEIAGEVFYYKRGITKVIIPSSITKIGRLNFSSCRKLTSIEVEEGNVNFASDGGVLFSKDMTKLIQAPALLGGNYKIPESVQELGDSAFRGCRISSLHIPASVVKTGRDAFADLQCSGNISVDKSNPIYACIDRALLNKDKKIMLALPKLNESEYVIPDGVEELASGAFDMNKQLSRVILPDSLKVINRDVFSNFRHLTSIDFPDSLEVIGQLSFSNSSIRKIHLPKNVKEVGAIAFRDCNDLSQITVDAENPHLCSVDSVLYSRDMTKLVTCLNSKAGVLKVPDSVKIIGSWPFDSCDNITAIHLPDSVEKLENGAFIRARGLSSIVIPPKVNELHYYSFLECDKLKWILFLGDAPQVNRNAFMSCPTTVKIYYLKSAKGFSSPKWNGYETKACSKSEVKKLLKESRRNL